MMRRTDPRVCGATRQNGIAQCFGTFTGCTDPPRLRGPHAIFMLQRWIDK